jgi:uncharacterized protein YlxW (UPF0749 family)
MKNNKMKSDIARIVCMTLVCLLLGIIISWQFQGISKNKKLLSDRNKRNEEILTELINERNNNDKLRLRIEKLQEDLNAYKMAQGDFDEYTKQLEKEMKEARMIAGLVPVKGTGVILKIDSTYGPYLENDLLRIINELRASEIQAISINEQRVISTTEIKVISSGLAQGYLVVNGEQMLMPIEIKVIANPGNLENAIMMTGGLLERLKFLFTTLELKKVDEVIIPAVRDDGTVIRTDLMTPVL